MDVTTMAKTSSPSAFDILRAQFPAITFESSDGFRWSPYNTTVYAGQLKTQNDLYLLLHETGHAIAGHASYTQDIRLLKLEREAWDIAQKQLAPLFAVTIPQDFIEDALDTYRDWLYARSLCPVCSSNGVQENEQHYRCLACGTGWKVNDARQCQLRRHITK